MTAKQLKGSFAPDGSTYVTLTDGNGTLATSGGGITIGSSAISGGATTQVLFNLAGVVSSDSGFTYAGSSGAVTAGGLLGTSSAGTAANPSVFIGNTTTGFRSVSTTGFGTSINGVSKLDYGISTASKWTVTDGANFTADINIGGNQITIGNNFVSPRLFLFSPGNGELRFAQAGGTNLSVLSTVGTATFQFGQNDVNGAPVAQTLKFQSALAGSASNQASANTTIIGSLGTGTGTNGDIIFQVGVKVGSGTGAATTTTALTIKGENAGIIATSPFVLPSYTVATLPSSPGTGAIALVTDQLTSVAAKGTAPTGGGSVKEVVVYTGAGWVSI